MMLGKWHPCAKRRATLTCREFENEGLASFNDEFAGRHQIDSSCKQNAVAPRIAMKINCNSIASQKRI
ncbi:hypothetical protein [Paraburkholderia sediminicola]|uniref:hypothetical protein n=1 Tax=Paraburkholderia sediminicola TaxID=458836 RepID=UPI0038BC1906